MRLDPIPSPKLKTETVNQQMLIKMQCRADARTLIGVISLENVEHMHHYQRERTSPTGLGL